ncbi:MAG: glutamate-1-semialdehyde 2,1-aminomutase [Gammaproteobacteria bacterium]|nr:glutamate-1-semialdehyde 2,1-aminomutase [Gammaproteobacteria bacterium]
MADSSWFDAACRKIPGGVNSPVRAFGAVGGTPVFMQRGEGAYLYDVEGRSYIDYVGAWGPMIVGHAHPAVLERIKNTVDQGICFGTPHPLETEMAEKLCQRAPTLEKVRLVNSGTEAAMSAIRLARGVTARDRIIKFAGCYHGHADALLVQAGSGALTHGVPSSPGVPASTVEHAEIAQYNDAEEVRAIFADRGDQIAAIIVEPIAGNMSCVLPEPGFLEALRDCCDRYGSLLIFDEVMTGFRVGPGGAQQRLGIQPDLTVLGKVIGGGLPVGAFGGRAELMDQLAPLGPVYQAGTLSGNPVTMAAGLATLELTEQEGFYEALGDCAARLMQGLREQADTYGISFEAVEATGMFGIFFTSGGPVRCYADVQACQTENYRRFFHHMLKQGIYLAPSSYEAGFLSSAHTHGDIDRTIEAAGIAFDAMRQENQ